MSFASGYKKGAISSLLGGEDNDDNDLFTTNKRQRDNNNEGVVKKRKKKKSEDIVENEGSFAMERKGKVGKKSKKSLKKKQELKEAATVAEKKQKQTKKSKKKSVKKTIEKEEESDQFEGENDNNEVDHESSSNEAEEAVEQNEVNQENEVEDEKDEDDEVEDEADEMEDEGEEVKVNKGGKVDELEDDEIEDDESEEEEEPSSTQYTQPSRRHQVKLEDEKPRGLFSNSNSNRTVFVGNLPSDTITKKKLIRLCSKFGKIESARLRGASRPDEKTTKKVAVIKKSFGKERNSINGYVKFENNEQAKICCNELNGFKLKEHVLCVNMADSERFGDRAVFVGNLSFAVNENELYDHFSSCGTIQSVRVVRDNSTGVGKGFGYVNFEDKTDANKAIEKLNGSNMGNREIRVKPCIDSGKHDKKQQCNRFSAKNGSNFDKRRPLKKNADDKRWTRGPSFMGKSSERKFDNKNQKKMKNNKDDRRRRNLSEKLLRN